MNFKILCMFFSFLIPVQGSDKNQTSPSADTPHTIPLSSAERIHTLESNILVSFGRQYEKGINAPHDPIQAFSYYAQAAALSHPEGHAGCGIIAAQALRNETDKFSSQALNAAHHAVSSLSIAVDMNVKRACFHLACLYDDGFPIYTFKERAFSLPHYSFMIYVNKIHAANLYEKARQLGSKKATRRLAFFYENGIGVMKNTEITTRLYADIGCAPSYLTQPSNEWTPFDDSNTFFQEALFGSLDINSPPQHHTPDEQ